MNTSWTSRFASVAQSILPSSLTRDATAGKRVRADMMDVDDTSGPSHSRQLPLPETRSQTGAWRYGSSIKSASSGSSRSGRSRGKNSKRSERSTLSAVRTGRHERRRSTERKQSDSATRESEYRAKADRVLVELLKEQEELRLEEEEERREMERARVAEYQTAENQIWRNIIERHRNDNVGSSTSAVSASIPFRLATGSTSSESSVYDGGDEELPTEFDYPGYPRTSSPNQEASTSVLKPPSSGSRDTEDLRAVLDDSDEHRAEALAPITNLPPTHLRAELSEIVDLRIRRRNRLEEAKRFRDKMRENRDPEFRAQLASVHYQDPTGSKNSSSG